MLDIGSGGAGAAVSPLDRARQVRVNVLGHRLANVRRAAGAAGDWFAALPLAVQLNQSGSNFSGALLEVHQLADEASNATKANQGETAADAQLRLISDADLTNRLSAQILALAGAINRLASMLLPLHVESEALRGRAGRNMAPFDDAGRMRVLHAASAAMLVDSRWLAAQAARVSSASLAPTRANVERVKRYRARQKEGFSTVTVHYHENDLSVLRELGFLHGNGPYEATDIAAAFEAFQQAALAMVASPDDDREGEVLGIFHVGDPWGHWRIRHWAERLAALLRVGGK